MARISKKYVTLGLRREKNFSDVLNKSAALNNLLNNLVVDADPGTDFISEDLDAFRGIKNTNVNNTKLLDLEAMTVQYSKEVKGSRIIQVGSMVSNGQTPSSITITTALIPGSANYYTHGFFTGNTVYVENAYSSFSIATSTVEGSAIVITSSTVELIKGAYISGNPNIPAGATVESVLSSTSFLISETAVGTVNDVSTTITRPDLYANGVFKVTVIDDYSFTYTTEGYVDPGAALYVTNNVSGLNTVVASTLIQDFSVNPLVTIKDRIENVKTITGENPSVRGGLGLMARFIPSININAPGTETSTGANGSLFQLNDVSQPQDLFWDRGYFSFPGAIDKTFTNQYGAVQWTGYFSPEPYDPSPTIYFSSTGLMMFEFDQGDDGSYETLKLIYTATRPLTNTASATVTYQGSSVTQITLAAGQYKFVSTNDRLISITSNQVTNKALVLGDSTKTLLTFQSAPTLFKSKVQIYDSVKKMTRSLEVLDGSGTNILTVSTTQAKNIIAAATQVVATQLTVTVNSQVSEAKVVEVTTDNKITLNGTLTVPSSFYVTKIVGEEETGSYAVLDPTEIFDKLKVRISLWYPDTGENVTSKITQFTYISSELAYPYMYKEKPLPLIGLNELRAFLRDSVSPIQPEIGVKGNNKSLFVNSSFVNQYHPRSSLSTAANVGILKQSGVTLSFNNLDRIVKSTNVAFSNVVTGDIVVPTIAKASTKIQPYNTDLTITGITLGATTTFTTDKPHGRVAGMSVEVSGISSPVELNNTWVISSVGANTITVNVNSSSLSSYTGSNGKILARPLQVKDFFNSNTASLTTNLGSVVTETVNIIDHKGFVAWYFATIAQNSTTVTVDDVSKLRLGYNVITSSTSTTAFVRITSINTASNTFTTDVTLNTTANTEVLIYVYSDRGLIDASKDNLCAGVFGRVLNADISTGATSFVVKAGNGTVANGQVVQYGTVFPGDTLVTGVTQSGSGITATYTVTVNKAATGPLIAGVTIVFGPAGPYDQSGLTVNKEGCVMPGDTSPPFAGTDIGLRSGTNVAVKSSYSGADGFLVKANALEANYLPTASVVASQPSTYNRIVTIKNTTSAGLTSTYRILGSDT